MKLCRRAEQFVDVAFPITHMDTPARTVRQMCSLLHVLQPSDTLFLFDGHPRGVDTALEHIGALELAARPEFSGAEPQGRALQRHDQTGMHQDAADGVACDSADQAHAADVTLIGGLRRVVQ